MRAAVLVVLAIVRVWGRTVMMIVMLVGIAAVIVVRVGVSVHHGGGHSCVDAESQKPFERKTHSFP